MSHTILELPGVAHEGNCEGTLCTECGCCGHCADDDHCEGTSRCAWNDCGCGL